MPSKRPEELRVGDRVEYTGPDFGPGSGAPRPGEHGTIVHLSPYDDVVVWDDTGPLTGHMPHLRRVEEADPDATG
jgi:hypothetical protein